MGPAKRREIDRRDLHLDVGSQCSFSPPSLIVQGVSYGTCQKCASKHLAGELCLHDGAHLEPSTLPPSLGREAFLGNGYKL